MSVDLVIAMEIPSDIAFAPVLTSAAEAMARRRGLDRRESLRFQLTVEELFVCLVGLGGVSPSIHVTLTGKPHLLRVAFSFVASTLCLGALNAAACMPVSAEGEPPHDLGLLLAGKAADRFHIELKGETRFRIEAEVDRVYPPASPVHVPTGWRPPFTARGCADSGQLAYAAALAAASYPAWHCPQSFQTPGKFADMVADGQVACVAAFDTAGQVAGLLSWTPCSDNGLYFSGPFVFVPREQAETVARRLCDAFLETVAREKYDIVLSLRATQDSPPGYFESLGALALCRDDACCQQPVFFRHLREDAGMAVWCHPRLEAFLLQAYDRLAMSRDILLAAPPAARPRRESLLGTAFDRKKNLGELRPLLDGEDMVENLDRHVCALRQRGVDNILYYMDISRAWDAALADDLTQAGFSPKVVLPHGGRGDMVVWQYAPAH